MDQPVSRFAVVVPMANESKEFDSFITAVKSVLDKHDSITVYLVVDDASKDDTREKCAILGTQDRRFISVYEPENRNVVDAYLRGYREAILRGHEFIIEMDAGLSHDPAALPQFIGGLESGYDCVFGSRFIRGGSMKDSGFKRIFLSKAGTYLANFLLGTSMKDMTSGFQGFRWQIAEEILSYGLLSKAHFYQTEVRYLLRKTKFIELPIHYRAPSPNVSQGVINDSLKVLFYYFIKRLSFKPVKIDRK